MAITTLVKQDDSTADVGANITAPDDIQAGDLLVMADYAANVSSDPGEVVPTDWDAASSTVATLGSITGRKIISYKIADGSEASATVTGMNGTAFSQKIILVFRADVPIATVTPNTFGSQYTTGNPSAQTVAASGGAPPLIILGSYGGNGVAIDPRTFTVGGSPAKDGEVSSVNYHYFAWKIYLSSPADASIDMDDEGSFNALQSGYLEVQGAAGGQPTAKRFGGVPFMGAPRAPQGGQVWMPDRRLLLPPHYRKAA